MKNRGWIILNLLFMIYVIMRLEGIDTEFYEIKDCVNNIRKEVDSDSSIHRWSSIAYKINKMEKRSERLESNLKQVVESCGKYWNYY